MCVCVCYVGVRVVGSYTSVCVEFLVHGGFVFVFNDFK